MKRSERDPCPDLRAEYSGARVQRPLERKQVDRWRAWIRQGVPKRLTPRVRGQKSEPHRRKELNNPKLKRLVDGVPFERSSIPILPPPLKCI